MSCYKALAIENQQLRQLLVDAQNEVDMLIESLHYGPEFIDKEDVIRRLEWLDLPPLVD